MITIDKETQPILLEALEDLMYKISLQLNDLKGGPMNSDRRELSRKQELIEALQHQISQP